MILYKLKINSEKGFIHTCQLSFVLPSGHPLFSFLVMSIPKKIILLFLLIVMAFINTQ